MRTNSHRIIDFSRVDKVDLDLTGKKAYILGELKYLNIPIPDGFIITNLFFDEFLQRTGILQEIVNIKNSIHPALYECLPKLFEPIQKKIMRTYVPQHLAIELYSFYRKLTGVFKEPAVNIYSCVKKGKSIAFCDTKGDANLVIKIKKLLAYYLDKPFSVIVQKAVKSKNKKSIITNDPALSDPNLLKLAKKIQNHFYFPYEIEYFIEKGKIFVTEIKPFTGIVRKLAKIEEQIYPFAFKLQGHIPNGALIFGSSFDLKTNTVSHLKATVGIYQKVAKSKQSGINNFRKTITKGVSINPGIVTGPVKLINRNFVDFKKSEIAVIKNLDKSMFNKMKMAKGIIADTLLQSSIDRLNYRKTIKSPTIIGTQNSTKLLGNGDVVTVNGTTGEIYSGGLI